MLKHYGKGDSEPSIDQSKLNLYTYQFCPFARRVHLVLYHHSIEHEKIYVNIKNKPDWFISCSPTGKVPMIEKEGEKLLESDLICRYLDQLMESGNLVTNSSQDSIKSVLNWCDKYLPAFIPLVYCKAYTQEQEQIFLDSLTAFENLLSSGFISGDTVSLADFLIYPFFDIVDLCLERLGQPLLATNYQRTWSWLQLMESVPAVQKEKINQEAHREYMKYIKTLNN